MEIQDLRRVLIVGAGTVGQQVALQSAWHIAQYWAKVLNDPQLQTCADFLKTYVDRGCLGVKAGQGFYTYPHPLFQQPGFLTGESTPPT